MKLGVALSVAAVVLAGCGSNTLPAEDVTGTTDCIHAQKALSAYCSSLDGGACPALMVSEIETRCACVLGSMLHRHGADDTFDGGGSCQE